SRRDGVLRLDRRDRTRMIPGVVREAVRRFRDEIAIVAPDGTPISYLDLYKRSEAVAGGFLAQGIKAGDVVALTFGSSIEYVLAYLGAARIGAITSGINPRYSDEERAKVLDRLQPTIVIESPDELPSGEAPQARLPVDPDRPVVIVFTSGTTGE